MNLEYFENLSCEEQVAVVKESGVLISEREDGIHDMFLFQLYSFYVEMTYNKSDKELWRIGPFDHPVMLRPYLDQIDISTLFQ
jgi:hypothetical protein